MSNKIWNFDILVDDCFVNFNTKKQEINPAHSILSSYRENRNVSDTLFTVNGYNLVAVPVRKLKYIYFHNLSF